MKKETWSVGLRATYMQQDIPLFFLPFLSAPQAEAVIHQYRSLRMRLVPVLSALAMVSLGFVLGFSFPASMTPNLQCGVLPWSGSTNSSSSESFLGRLWAPLLRNSSSTSNATSGVHYNIAYSSELFEMMIQFDFQLHGLLIRSLDRCMKKLHYMFSDDLNRPAFLQIVNVARRPEGAGRLPPGIVVSESDLHLRRLWGSPTQDAPVRKYLLTMAVGHKERANVNATVHKFSDKFDVVLFHYDGHTTEWDDDFHWSKEAVHVSARKQTKWYIDIVKKHGLEISQPGLDSTKGKSAYKVSVKRNSGEMHK
uniref:Uncharacterized protein n=1 Tax=Aegilops tauschii TaxID=37682 RepID=M8C082_AEGTA